MRENFKITSIENGKEYWIARNVAVCGIIYGYDSNGYLKTLMSKRGKGCPDFIGKYNFICGYLNWDESLKDGLYREIYEETGLDLNNLENITKLWTINDSITGENSVKQNITIRYKIIVDINKLQDLIDSGVINNDTVSRGGELDEVEDIVLLDVNDNLNENMFAFNHYEIFNSLKYDN